LYYPIRARFHFTCAVLFSSEAVLFLPWDDSFDDRGFDRFFLLWGANVGNHPLLLGVIGGVSFSQFCQREGSSMSFNSWAYLIFLPVVILLSYLLPPKIRWIVLLVASYVFYAFVTPWLAALLGAFTLVSYLFGLGLAKAERPARRKLLLSLGLFLVFGTLFVFKYLSFCVKSMGELLAVMNSSLSPITLQIILPVGISFYSFQCASYLIDVYRKPEAVERHFGYYALFIAFFPQLVAGPIERSDHLLPQLKNPQKWDGRFLQEGLPLLASGFFKKIVVADYLASFVEASYGQAANAEGLGILLSTLLFGVQIYCDFSGYCDIAMGSAQLLGLSLSPNFDQPYLALNPQDFWHRWHCSLTRWFTDYVYIPLGGSRHGKFRQCLNIFLVFLLSGLWHGAAWHFLIWGALHGAFLVGYTLLKEPLKRRFPSPSIFGKILGIFITAILVNFAWIFFRASSLSEAGHLIRVLFTNWAPSLTWAQLSLTGSDAIKIPLLLLSVVLIDELVRHPLEAKTKESFDPRLVFTFFSVVVIALAWLSLLNGAGASHFIYFDF